MSAQFNILSHNPSAALFLQQKLGLPRFVAATLVARGITTFEDAKDFLNPSLERDSLDPYLIPGLKEVADSLETALRQDQHIVVFGDFDLDGISATATLTRGLRALGAHVTPFIPLRFEEGYGLSLKAFERVLKLDPDFIVTVDCGIASKEEAKVIVEAGIGLAITDHHEPADLVPEGVPVADPKLEGDCPSSLLAGVGVALKLVQVLGGRFGKPHLWREFTDLAALGTIADLMPMRSENRALVSDGVKRMNESPRTCISALLQAAGAGDKPITATNLSFSIIPRLNAAGRMGDASYALDLLLSDDYEEATKNAAQLEAVNDKRRAIEAELSEIAKAQASEIYVDQRALVVAGEGWHEGVKGIVASRLVNTYGVPVMLFSIEDDEAHGSGRSVGQVNLFKAVDGISDIITRFGGHEAAVGVTLPADKLPEFVERLTAYMENLPAESFHPRITIDDCVSLEELSLGNVELLQKLAPFGQENPVPRYLARDITLTNCRAVGAEKNHFSCTLSDGKHTVAGIMFHCSDIETLMHCGSVVNAAFEIQVDEWRGRKSVKAMLSSLAPAQTCAGLEACLNPDSLSFVADLYAACSAENCTDCCHESAKEIEAYEAKRTKNRAYWEKQAQDNPHVLQQSIIKALIGSDQLHESQRLALDSLANNESVLAVMATGRGKSLIFYVHAAKEALLHQGTSLFVYPLRALIADQLFHINETLEAFGIAAAVLTGESTPEERRDIFEGIHKGEYDIVLTTPEFLSYHVDEFAQTERIGFVVIDEAHHIGLAKAGQRIAYATIGNVINRFDSPTILALTATANSPIADAITSALGIEKRILDDADRPNLELDDQRNLKNRESYLANLIATGEKTVIYVNSREQSVALARVLRKLVPQMALMIGFYNAGLNRSERKRVEDLFRTDALCILVATSAFGEGVNIPHIRHVVLYHLPFNEIEFNQMSGRAGRDGEKATIHLLFGRGDIIINENILRVMTPEHDCMAQIYRELRRMQQESDQDFFTISTVELAALASKNRKFTVEAGSVVCGIAVFRELGLIKTHTAFVLEETMNSVHVCDAESKVELTDSVRYREGLGEREVFHTFRDWAMTSSHDALQTRISRPILPTQVIM